MPRQRRILIIDHDDTFLTTWRTELGEKFHITSAQSIPDAEEIIAETPEFAAIVVESFEDAGCLRAIPFIERLRQRFHKPIIGIAAKHQQQQAMILAGCNVYAARSNLPNRICEALRLYDPSPQTGKRSRQKRSWQKAHPRERDPAK